jgi:hypothetical protein
VRIISSLGAPVDTISSPVSLSASTLCTTPQFYIPLFLSSIICMFAFGLFVHHLIAANPAATSSDHTAPAHQSRMAEQREAERRGVFLRLGGQLAVMMIVFLPDAFSYYATTYFADSYAYPASAYKATGIIWKSESWMIALMWFSNLRIQTGIRTLFGCETQVPAADMESRRVSLVHARPRALDQSSQSLGSEPPSGIGNRNHSSAKVAPTPTPDTASDRIESTAFQAVEPGPPV